MQTKDLLDCSQDVLRAEKALEVQYEEYYEQLADQQSLSPEEQAALRSDVTREVEMLEDASSCLRQAHQWASDKADELTTRLREGQESSQRKGLFRRAPANSVIDLEEEQADSFASGVNFYKVALICIAAALRAWWWRSCGASSATGISKAAPAWFTVPSTLSTVSAQW